MLLQTDSLIESYFDKVAEWLKKLNTNPLVTARMVSNPVFIMFLVDCMEK